jgi:hypothetical protein
MNKVRYNTKKETYFRKELYDENGNKYYQTKEKASNGFYKIITRYSKDNITTEYIKGYK